MKQRIRVTAICRDGEEILLLKRANGRVSEEMGFELPKGKIVFGEQPEEAMVRVLYDYAGVRVEGLRLIDAITFTHMHETVELGNLFIVYEIKVKKDEVKVEVNSERYGAYKWAKREKMTELSLEEESAMVLQITGERLGMAESRMIHVVRGGEEMVRGQKMATIYTDGGSRGNPGPSGVGYYILDEDGRELKRGGEFLGFSSSRLAEYYGLKEGIEQAIELGLKRVNFRSDSLMMVNQMNGVYKVKNKDLWQVHSDVLRLLGKLEAYSFTHVPRSRNVEADREVNRAIEEGLGK